MKKIIIGSLAVLLAVLFSGCADKVHSYSPKTANILYLKGISDGKKAFVDKFSDSGKGESKLVCRLMAPIGTPDGETFASYIQDAFVQELAIADKYDAKSANIISANLDDIYGSTMLGNAYWEFKITMKSSSGVSYETHSRYDYESSYNANSACSEMQRSFVPAVQKLVGDVINNPKFTDLFAN